MPLAPAGPTMVAGFSRGVLQHDCSPEGSCGEDPARRRAGMTTRRQEADDLSPARRGMCRATPYGIVKTCPGLIKSGLLPMTALFAS